MHEKMLRVVLKTYRAASSQATKKDPAAIYWKGSESHSSFVDKRKVFVDKIQAIEPSPMSVVLFHDDASSRADAAIKKDVKAPKFLGC